jgi:hypothetical protein
MAGGHKDRPYETLVGADRRDTPRTSAPQTANGVPRFRDTPLVLSTPPRAIPPVAPDADIDQSR